MNRAKRKDKEKCNSKSLMNKGKRETGKGKREGKIIGQEK